MTPEQRDQLSGMAAVFAQGSLIDYVADLLVQARADERAELTAEVERLRADAGRYRWIRAHFEFDYCKGTCDYWRIVGEAKTISTEHQTLDAAIDAALAIKEAGNG